METKIKLKKENILRVGIDDENGNDTGNYLEFDLDDIELPLKWQNVEVEHKKNLNYLKTNFAVIQKKPIKEGKKLMSNRQEERLKVLKEFYVREMKNLDTILGEGGCEKILHGRQPYYSLFEDVLDYLDQLEPYFEQGLKNAKQKVIDKYKIDEEDLDKIIEG